MSGSHHAIPLKYLVRTFLALIFFTVLTILAATVDFGHPTLNLVIAIAIATCKATVVSVFFMGLYMDKRLNVAIFTSNILFLFLFFFITTADLSLRSVSDIAEGDAVPFESSLVSDIEENEDDSEDEEFSETH